MYNLIIQRLKYIILNIFLIDNMLNTTYYRDKTGKEAVNE